MNVKKGVSTPWKGHIYQPKTLALDIFSIQFFSQASTPSLPGQATQHLHDEAQSAESAIAYMNSHIYSKINILRSIFAKSNYR